MKRYLRKIGMLKMIIIRYEPMKFSDLPQYNSANYSLSDFESYIEFKFKEQLGVFESLQANLFKRIHDQDESDKLQYFSLGTEFFIPEFNGTLTSYNTSVFEGFISYPQSFIRGISSTSLPQSFVKNTTDRQIRFFLVNGLNGFYSAYSSYSSYLYIQLTSTFKDFIPFVINSLSTLLALTALLLIASSASIWMIKRLIDNIYLTLTSLRQHDFAMRIHTMQTLDYVLAEFKREFFCKDFLGTKELLTEDKTAAKGGSNKSKSTTKKKSVKFTCYGLATSLGFILLYYLLQMIIYFIMLYVFSGNIRKALWISERHDMVKELYISQLFTYTSFQQYLIFGDTLRIRSANATLEMSNIETEIKLQSKNALNLDQDNTENQPYVPLKDYLTLASKQSLCSFVPDLINKTDMCIYLENQIPKNGYMQVFLRNIQYTSDLYLTLLHTDSNKTRLQILNDPEYIGWEYALEEIYWKAYTFLLEKTTAELDSIITDIIQASLRTNIIQLTSAFVLLSILFISISFRNISKQINTVMLNFQLIPIGLVVDNSLMKIRFIELLRLNKNYF